ASPGPTGPGSGEPAAAARRLAGCRAAAGPAGRSWPPVGRGVPMPSARPRGRGWPAPDGGPCRPLGRPGPAAGGRSCSRHAARSRASHTCWSLHKERTTGLVVQHDTSTVSRVLSLRWYGHDRVDASARLRATATTGPIRWRQSDCVARDNHQTARSCMRTPSEVRKTSLGVDVPVLPAPGAAVEDPHGDPGSAIVVYIRNQDLQVAPTVAVPATLTGSQFGRLVRKKLALPDKTTMFGGRVGLRFQYRFKYNDQPLPDDAPEALNIAHASVIDLEVRTETFGPNGSSNLMSFRADEKLQPNSDTAATAQPDGSTRISQAVVDSLKERAFSHLRPTAPTPAR